MAGRDFLRKLTIGELVADFGEVHSCNLSDPASLAVEKLLDYSLQAIPLFNPDTDRWVFFLDLVDVIEYTSKVMETNELIEGEPVGFLGIVKSQEKWDTATCANVKGNNPRGDHLIEVSPSTKLRDAMAAMANTDFHIQRLPVVENNVMKGIVSLSRIIREVYKVIDQFEFKDKTVDELYKHKFSQNEVFVAKQTDTVSGAVSLMREHNVTAVGIVDKEGKLVGNFSATDIKRHVKDLTTIISTHLKDFIAHVEYPPEMSYPVAVTGSATMEEVFAKFRFSGVHRVYVVDSTGKPEGVISAKDLIQLLVHVADGEELVSEDE